MALTANITPIALSDGNTYCTNVPITSSEADLGDAISAIATEFGQAILAIVQITVNGIITANNTYIVMQMDMGDGVWVDANWCVTTINQGTATFVFSNGVAGNNTFQQTRQNNASPSSSSNNQLALGGRIRFTGKTLTAGGSSAVSGTPTNVSATIKYKLLGNR